MFALAGSVLAMTNTFYGDVNVDEDISAQGDIFFRGNTNESFRFTVDGDTNMTTIEKYVDTLWQPASLLTGPNSLWVGRNVGVAGMGHHLATESVDGHLHFHAHEEFNIATGLSSGDTQVVYAYGAAIRLIAQPDASGIFTGSELNWFTPAVSHILLSNLYYNTSSAATDNVRIRFYEGEDDTGYLLFDQTYPVSFFPADSEIELSLDGMLEFYAGFNYSAKITSEGNFSLRSNAAKTEPWYAVDASYVREDNLLQTMGWMNGTNFTDGQLLIDNRQIYVSNAAGVQIGTWEGNSDNWDLISERYVSNYATGWLEGGDITINGGNNSLIKVAAGSVLITNYTDQMNPIITKISWENQTALDPGLVGRSTWVGIKDDGFGNAEFVYNVSFDSVDRRSTAILGRIWDNAGTGPQITSVGDYERPAWGLQTAFQDFVIEYGSWNIYGNVYSANGSNLYLDKSAGSSFRYHAEDIPGLENVHADAAQTPRTPYAYHLQGLDVVTSEVDIDPNYYDLSGVKTVMPNNKWQIQEIWYFPVSGTCHVLYGQDYYNSKGDAISALSTEIKVRNAEILDGAIKRAYLIVQQGATELNDLDTAELREKNGMTGGGSPYWQRDDGVLSPSESGDNLRLDTGGQIIITDMTEGSIPFFGATNILSQDNSNLFWKDSNNRLGIGTNDPARTLHIQDDNGVIRIDRDANSPAFILARFPNNNYTTPWKSFIFGVAATGSDNGTFHITDIHTNVAGGGDRRLTIENDGTVDVPGNFVADKIYLQDSGSDYMDWQSGDGVFRFSGGLDVGGTLFANDISGYDWTGATIDATDYILTPIIRNTDGDILTVEDNLDVKGLISTDFNNGGGLKVNRGTVNVIEAFMDSTYTDLRYSGSKDYNRIGTWMNKSFQIVTDSTPRITIDGLTGNVGIGTTDPEYILSLLSTAPIIKFENSRTIMGQGYNVGGLIFKAGEDEVLSVAEIRVIANEAWTNTSSPTRMEFFTTAVGAIGNTVKMIILPNGDTGIGVGFDVIEQILHVGGSIKTNEAIFFNDGSTQTSAQDGFLGHISTAVFKNNFSTAGQDTSPRDMQFKPDGTKVYISGVQGDGIVWEYDLSYPWNISSMTYNSNYFSVETWENNPMGLFIRNDGKKMYICGSGGDEVNEFNLGTAWDITSANWVSLFDVSDNETQPAGVEFRPDGKKMYIIGTSSDAVNEYDLTISWDVTTAVWNQAFGIDIDAPTGFRFKQDGTRMYVMDGSVEDDIHEYILSTPWDISTAILQELFDVSSQNGVPQDIAFSPDMTKAYMLGSTSPASVFEYDLGISAEGKIIGDGSELTGLPLYFTCGENGNLDPGAEWSCGGNGEVNQYVYLWDNVTATGMALDCNTGAGTAILRLETLAGGDTGCNMTSTGENAVGTYNCDIDSGNWFRPYTVSNGGHASCVVTMRFITR